MAELKVFAGLLIYITILIIANSMISISVVTGVISNDNIKYELSTDLKQNLQDEGIISGNNTNIQFNETAYNNYIDNNKISVFLKSFWFNITGLGIWSILFVFLPITMLILAGFKLIWW